MLNFISVVTKICGVYLIVSTLWEAGMILYKKHKKKVEEEAE